MSIGNNLSTSKVGRGKVCAHFYPPDPTWMGLYGVCCCVSTAHNTYGQIRIDPKGKENKPLKTHCK